MMIKNAKASIIAVKAFSQSVIAVRDYSPKFDRGVRCIDSLIEHITMSVSVLQDNLDDMTTEIEALAIKINDIKEILSTLTAQLNSLEETLSELEFELNSIPSSITLTNDEGESVEIRNPEYAAVCDRIAIVEGDISSVRAEMFPHEARLSRANSVSSRLASHINAINAVLYSLAEKKSACSHLRIELENLKAANQRQGSIAAEKLRAINDIISEYQRVKMVYNSILPSAEVTDKMPEINVSVSFSQTTYIQEPTVIQQSDLRVSYSKDEIEKHRIAFDKAGRVSSYDGKTFGGKYNTYQDRLDRTFTDNSPVLGHYEGVRGESKFVPSNRSAEGISVIEILNRYGLNGIIYRNAEPDFEVCAEAVVVISSMTENRENYMNSFGKTEQGNFSQADIELAKAWNLGCRNGRNDWKARDVTNYRQENKLTWHEKCDTRTMVLVPMEINLFFKHSGGCSECRVRDGGEFDGGGFDE